MTDIWILLKRTDIQIPLFEEHQGKLQDRTRDISSRLVSIQGQYVRKL
jgi:hypothetical protein